ncbi:hypothetical protein NL676_033138 [Syzygium grande]|nr:hypothetical protein NL676_033138 [Syzygium grande]
MRSKETLKRSPPLAAEPATGERRRRGRRPGCYRPPTRSVSGSAPGLSGWVPTKTCISHHRFGPKHRPEFLQSFHRLPIVVVVVVRSFSSVESRSKSTEATLAGATPICPPPPIGSPRADIDPRGAARRRSVPISENSTSSTFWAVAV